MILMTFLQAYELDELIPVINEMFPGTGKYREQFKMAYDMMLDMTPVPSKSPIAYKVIKVPKSDEAYMGAEDSCFRSTWQVTLGKEVKREKGVDLDDIEVVANSFVNMCLQGKCPPAFESARQRLLSER